MNERKMKARMKHEKHYCPECHCDILAGKSRQVSVDSCEMWFECSRCGYDVGEEHHVETIWGWQDEYRIFAIQCWIEGLEERMAELERKVK